MREPFFTLMCNICSSGITIRTNSLSNTLLVIDHNQGMIVITCNNCGNEIILEENESFI